MQLTWQRCGWLGRRSRADGSGWTPSIQVRMGDPEPVTRKGKQVQRGLITPCPGSREREPPAVRCRTCWPQTFFQGHLCGWCLIVLTLPV